ncbi:AfsR/SARP family transcriptional regulator [Streptomyces sp. KE1]|uniref:AfsR/SARP family transcriptional regulator n=1 Tax=Streptomyces sp. KE1 TaxID=1638939 RepID=UPI00131B15CC|nr:AfsR/SARP family transcriptional regulator [Streptomyces sp. KE1]
MAILEIRLLGALEVLCRGEETYIPAGKQRALLASLALNAGRTVAVDEIARHLWGPAHPPSARVTVRGHVKRLRKLLDGPGAQWPSVIAGRDGGYQLRPHHCIVDVERFRQRIAEASRAGTPEEESRLLDEALALWRGEPLGGVESSALNSLAVPELEEGMRNAAHRRIALALKQGGALDFLPRLRALLASDPLQERFWSQLVDTLHEAGRRAEALQAYDACVRVLRAELGTGPGAELRELRHRVLANRGRLSATGPPGIRGSATGPVRATGKDRPGERPGRLLGPGGQLWARSSDLAVLDRRLPPAGGAGQVVVVDGPAGVGKTALAAHWARLRGERFADGVLHADLKGYAAAEPVEPGAALGSLLRDLGVPPVEIPGDLRARSAMFRTLLWRRQMLVVLDNARDAGQVRPLLPGRGATVLVTSRSRMRDLVIRDGAVRHTLHPLPLPTAADVLTGLTRGWLRRGAAYRLAMLLGGVPFALHAVADTVTHYAGHDRAEPGDALRTALARVRSSLSWSCDALGLGARDLFRRLPYAPGRTIRVEDGAALAGLPLEPAHLLLDELAEKHLLEDRGLGRYRMPHYPLPPCRWAPVG